MKTHYKAIYSTKLLLLGITLALFCSQKTISQKTETQDQKFTIPKDQHFTEKIYPKGTGKSFLRFGDILVGRAVLPANTFSEGPTSGQYIGNGTINQQPVPFYGKQPVQGFSAVLNNFDGSFTALSDNGFGGIENSADYNLRLYHIKPRFETFFRRGDGKIEVLGFTELSDPRGLIPFAIVNHFTEERILTGADFDIESIQRTENGDYWIGDEFGPFILHFDKNGVLLDPPFALPDYDENSLELRAPQNPYNEEFSALRIMNTMRAHAASYGSKPPVMSPWYVMLKDNNENTFVGDRKNPSSSLKEASSEIFDVTSLNKAGHDVVVYTVNDLENMNLLLELGVQGIISDRPDLLLKAVQEYDGNNDGMPDYLDQDGLIDITRFDAQGHRGARNLRPENTLPSMEAALDNLMPTLETDCGITLDGIPILDHDPHIESAKTRKADGSTYNYEDEVLVKDLTLTEIQNTFIADKILPGRPVQNNDLTLSPVSVVFSKNNGLMNPYIMPSLQQVFDFVKFYMEYYKAGEGSNHPEASQRWKNAAKVRFNIETKINPRTDTDDRGDIFAERTVDPETFTKAIADVIIGNNLQDRADIQSFDYRTLLVSHQLYPEIRTVCLFGDFPKVDNNGDGTNLQDQNGQNTPWLGGLYWPYRSTESSNPFKVKSSGGFEGMALSADKKTLLPLLEKPLTSAQENNLLIHEFDLYNKSYNGKRFQYQMDEKASAIGDFIMFNEKRGLIIERDGSQGDLNGFKAIYEIELDPNNEIIAKQSNVDLLKIKDIRRISEPGLEGDVGIGSNFAFPFVTIESVVVFNPYLIGILNDNNYPFSVGRHVGQVLPDDNEFIMIWLDQPLGRLWWNRSEATELKEINSKLHVYPNTFKKQVTFSYNNEDQGIIDIKIYDIAGNLVKEISTGKVSNIVWDGTAINGSELHSGIYIAIIHIKGKFIKRKLIKK